ncbi:transmembrane transport protein [Mycobacteroides abscessus subsp. abscessus]|nr:MFS transporter [Mycobacteroides abscessus]SIK40188.1 transmembrane transport protein [Mycobacteroides abscessus subsp. abscessus]
MSAPPPQCAPATPGPSRTVPRGHVAGRTRTAATILVISAATFLASLDLFIVNLAFPAIQHAFAGHDLAATSWVLSAYTIVFAAFLNPAGRFGDRYGHRTVFLIGLGVFTLASAACGLAMSLPMLIAARSIQAVGAAMLMPTSLALLLVTVTPARRTAAVSTWAAVGASAAALGPPIGGALVELSWRWVFFVNLPIAVVAIAVSPWLLAKTPTTGSGIPDLIGAALLVAGVGGVVLVLVTLPDRGWSDPGIWAPIAAALAALAIVVVRSRRHHNPALDLHALRVGPLWANCLALLLFTTAFGGMLFGNVLFLTEVWHEPPPLAGLYLSPGPAAAVAVSAILAGRLIRRLGIGPVAVIGTLSFACGAATWLWRVRDVPDYFAAFLPGQMLTGIGVGLVIPSLSAIVAECLPQHRWGSGSAMVNTARQIGLAVGTAAVILLYQPVVDLDATQHGWVFLVAAAAAASVIAGAAALRWRNPADNAAAAAAT